MTIVKSIYMTGVEMEALTSCSVACLTIYDMCKSFDKEIIISNIRLIYKKGGKSGKYKNDKNIKALKLISQNVIRSKNLNQSTQKNQTTEFLEKIIILKLIFLKLICPQWMGQ